MNVGNVVSLFLILAIIGYFGFKYYKRSKTTEGSEDLRRFFNSIRNVVEDAMLEYLENIDISNITNITIMQKKVLEDLYDTVWNICVDELAKEVDETTAKIIRTLLTRKNIEQFINEIYESSIKVQETVTAKYNEEVLIAAARKEE